MHVRDGQAHQFVELLMPYLNKSSQFAAEMDLANIDPVQLHLHRRLPNDRVLTDYFSEKEYQKVRVIIKKSFGLDLDNHQNLHPFLIIALLAEHIMSADQQESLDYVLWRRAGDLNIDLVGLESFEDQLRIMQSIPIETSISQLKQVARNPRRLRRQIQRMLVLYQQQDISQLYKASKKQLQNLKRLLLYERNINMAGKIVDLSSHNVLFATMGAGHLAGRFGVLRLLKEKGCRLEPINI